ncbi:MAG: cohesin domain-containing protein [Saprospiraceae bacterium]|nr:cohesin domain-containing protein [Saprospiraceae bacterium]
MNNKLIFAALCLCFTFCSNEPAKQPDGQTAAEAVPVQNAQTVASATVGDLTLVAPKVVASAGETVCIDITVLGCNQLLSMQYSVRWDKNVLEFKELKNYTLPYLDGNNFGVNNAQDGLLTAMWIENSLKGITIADGSSIYQICYTVKGKSGQFSSINFVDKPTPFEAVNFQSQLLKIIGVDGKVTVK